MGAADKGVSEVDGDESIGPGSVFVISSYNLSPRDFFSFPYAYSPKSPTVNWELNFHWRLILILDIKHILKPF